MQRTELRPVQSASWRSDTLSVSVVGVWVWWRSGRGHILPGEAKQAQRKKEREKERHMEKDHPCLEEICGAEWLRAASCARMGFQQGSRVHCDRKETLLESRSSSPMRKSSAERVAPGVLCAVRSAIAGCAQVAMQHIDALQHPRGKAWALRLNQIGPTSCSTNPLTFLCRDGSPAHIPKADKGWAAKAKPSPHRWWARLAKTVLATQTIILWQSGPPIPSLAPLRLMITSGISSAFPYSHTASPQTRHHLCQHSGETRFRISKPWPIRRLHWQWASSRRGAMSRIEDHS